MVGWEITTPALRLATLRIELRIGERLFEIGVVLIFMSTTAALANLLHVLPLLSFTQDAGAHNANRFSCSRDTLTRGGLRLFVHCPQPELKKSVPI
jgi:hypothetical protein